MRWLPSVAAIALAAACVPTIPEGRYACAMSSECPPGLWCAAGHCVSREPPIVPDDARSDASTAVGDAEPSRADADPSRADAAGVIPPTLAPDLAVGARHACVVTRDGAVLTWGDNATGALGIPTTTPSSAVPVDVPSVPPARAVCAGVGFTCALTTTGEVWCWGASDAWQLGRTVASPARPDRVPDVPAARSIACGARHVCAATDDGTVCWGADELGQAGAAPTPRIAPHLVTDVRAIALTAGTAHTCALAADGTVTCWGAHAMGQLGPDVAPPTALGFSATPVRIESLGASAIAAGAQHTCAARTDGRVVCWGRADGGRIGFAGTGAHPALELVEGADFTRLVAGGDELSCASADAGATASSVSEAPPPPASRSWRLQSPAW